MYVCDIVLDQFLNFNSSEQNKKFEVGMVIFHSIMLFNTTQENWADML